MPHLTRRVWRTPRAGSLRRLTLKEENLPSLPPGHIRVQTRACGLNFADIFALLGLYSATPSGSFIPGLEFSGTVTETAPDITAFRPGDRVLGITRFGGYASIIDSPPQYCSPLPEKWSFEEGAAFPVQTLTAWYALVSLGNAQCGDWALVHSAAGGVGMRCLNICRHLGIQAIGTVRSQSKVDFLAERGQQRIIVRGPDFPRQVRNLLGDSPLSLALDAVGGWVQKESYRLLAPTGRLIAYGAALFMPQGNRFNPLKGFFQYLNRPRYDPLKLIPDNKSVMGFNLIWLWEQAEMMSRLLDEIAAAGLDPPHVGRAFPFEQAPQAVQHLQSGESVGKVVLSEH
ncbi:MAG: zinc-binding dehydrogenase [Acidobacteriota bacterium]